MPSPPPAQTGFISSATGEAIPYIEAWKNVSDLREQLDDARLIAEFGSLSGLTSDRIPVVQSTAVEVYADVRVAGQTDELRIRVEAPTLEHIQARFADAYEEAYGVLPPTAAIEIVILRVRRFGNYA